MKKKIKKWYMERKNHDDVIVSCRVRLARNISGFKFGKKISNEEAEKLVSKVRSIKKEIEGKENIPFYSCDVSKLSVREKNLLLETHAINREIFSKNQTTGLILSEDESLSIMINGRDHINIAAVSTGSDIKNVAATAGRIDDLIDTRFKYVFAEKYGYLTSSLADVGTGLKASYLLFIPAIIRSGNLKSLEAELTRFGLMLEAEYTEDRQNSYLYRLYNRRTLGIHESEIYESLEMVASQIATLERQIRRRWYEGKSADIEEKVYRSYGLLKYARSLKYNEAMGLLTMVEFGRIFGILKTNELDYDIQRLMLEIQPAMLIELCTPEDREVNFDRLRAEHIRNILPKIITETED